MSNLIIWLIVGVVLAGADMLLGTVYLLVLAVAAFATAILTFLGLPVIWEIAAFAMLSVVGCLFLSFSRKKNKNIQIQSATNLQNIDIGREVSVKDIKENGHATVFYRGTVWEAAPAKGYILSRGTWIISGLHDNLLILKPEQKEK